MYMYFYTTDLQKTWNVNSQQLVTWLSICVYLLSNILITVYVVICYVKSNICEYIRNNGLYNVFINRNTASWSFWQKKLCSPFIRACPSIGIIRTPSSIRTCPFMLGNMAVSLINRLSSRDWYWFTSIQIVQITFACNKILIQYR